LDACDDQAEIIRKRLQIIAICAPMIYTVPCLMFWMRAYSLRGQVGGGWALDIESFLGSVKWHRADRRVPFHRAQNTADLYRMGLGLVS
jgi:hypothetical protein